MNKLNKFLGFVVVGYILFSPMFSMFLFAQSPPPADTGLVVCGTRDDSGNITKKCGFDSFIETINKIMFFAIYNIMLPISALSFAYAGGLILFSGGETAKIQKAKGIFTSVLWGVGWMIGAWLAIYSVVNILGYEGDIFKFNSF
ncbi:MAG: hypothetical protein K9L98_03205 [Candidatus Pacebacteria bacterium]|nr:hypothetical protein [Candidatus Paceibacterota bacterium]MCF7862989.1 hypothetical protein [Candidatus Paceibacterota bacterium]